MSDTIEAVLFIVIGMMLGVIIACLVFDRITIPASKITKKEIVKVDGVYTTYSAVRRYGK